uniref:Protein phosphatase 1 regulatory subunit 14B n=2 Tax=Schistosoma mansoni TaxID=6183 RepID=A0A3Q0KD16_SCHMA
MLSLYLRKWIEVMNLGKEVSGSSDGFSEKGENREVVFATDAPADHSKRKRYLTAKYDRRTRQKISEKIRLENFVFEHLRNLYCTEVDDYDCDIDLDEISDLKTNDEKVRNLKEKLKSCPAKQEQIDEFIQNLLRKLK